MEWVRAFDQLPEAAGNFIVTTENGIGMAAYNQIEGFYNIHLTGRVQYRPDTVTHWMPFPDKASTYLEINAETRFDYSIRGQRSSFTLSELEQIHDGRDINIVAPGWEARKSTGLRIPNPGSGSNGNVMGIDYMYRWKNGELNDRLPMQSSEDK
ncbi:DUF551 domain-containing protein [Pseudescherichia sp.]|uniref:DUF551 domain-containing protein n=1 Tax=Pseudescherichia sp. TaxID=2055881 RepID=UPI00289CF50D|nr:DUF551 domain-containing protein [Pseudescherichia sp.]